MNRYLGVLTVQPTYLRNTKINNLSESYAHEVNNISALIDR